MNDRFSESAVPAVDVRSLSAEQAQAHLEQLVALLIECVDGGASVGFMAPLATARAQQFWQGVVASLGRGERRLLVALDAELRVVGTVELVVAMPDNQPHRADVAKMLVSPRARRRGIARALLTALEVEARAAGKQVLVLDTVTDSPAHRLYASAGWQRVGEIPKYALMPDGAFCATTYFYKHLFA